MQTNKDLILAFFPPVHLAFTVVSLSLTALAMSGLSVPRQHFHFIFSNEPTVSFLFMAFNPLLMREKNTHRIKQKKSLKIFLTGWCDEYTVVQKYLQKSVYYKMSILELLFKPKQFCIVILLRESVRIKIYCTNY